MFGIRHFSAVINPPQAAILAVSGGAQELRRKRSNPNEFSENPESEVEVFSEMIVQLSSDRRVVDETTAAQFLQLFRSLIENPKRLVA